jgi:RNA polymerase-binding transcription factor DksA
MIFRLRDREKFLLAKIDKALARIESGASETKSRRSTSERVESASADFKNSRSNRPSDMAPVSTRREGESKPAAAPSGAP